MGRLRGGWTLGTVCGVALGTAIGLSTVLQLPGMAVVSALSPVSNIALGPLFSIWFGIGEEPKVATLAFGVLFPTVLNTAARWTGCRAG